MWNIVTIITVLLYLFENLLFICLTLILSVLNFSVICDLKILLRRHIL
jgi:hypothetical protein